jgi:sugar phosphate isomerase/epimerase
MEFTRRDFGKLAMASVPAAAGLSVPGAALAAQSSKIDGVQVGVITYSFRQGVDKKDLPSVIQKIGLNEVELMSGDAEIIAGVPAAGGGGFGGGGGGRGGSGGRGGGRGGSGGFGGRGGGNAALAPNGCPANSPSGQDSLARSGQAPARGGGGGGRAMTPEQEAAQKAIADWRMAANASTWKGVRRKFNDAGVEVQILCYNMNLNTKDDEIEYAFQMARDLGVRAISCSATVAVAKRVAPFADKYKIMWGGHGHADIFDDEQFAKPETFKKIMSFSKYIGVNLDIGHFTAAGFDPLTFIPEVHDRITNIHVKDRMKPDQCYNSPNVVWGTGQTPIKEVLLLMKKNKYKFPANIEFEYQTPAGSDSVTEVTKCYEFIKKCFA